MRIKSKKRISGINVYFVPLAEVIQGQSVLIMTSSYGDFSLIQVPLSRVLRLIKILIIKLGLYDFRKINLIHLFIMLLPK